MSLKDRHRSIVVRGLVCPTNWDSQDAVRQVSIVTLDEDQYEVDQRDVGDLFVQLAGAEVIARGHILPDYRRRKVMRIKSFSIVNPN